MAIVTTGIDLANNIFAVHGMNETPAPTLGAALPERRTKIVYRKSKPIERNRRRLTANRITRAK